MSTEKIMGNVLGVALALLFCLTLFSVINTIEFFFYVVVFWLLLGPCSLLLSFPFNLIAAVVVVLVLRKKQFYIHFEAWIIHSHPARCAFLVAHVAAGLLAGRLIGEMAYDLMANPVIPRLAFELLGGGIITYVNTSKFLRRWGMTWRMCIDRDIVFVDR